MRGPPGAYYVFSAVHPAPPSGSTLEAVPNVSEGRDPAILRRLSAAAAPCLADCHTDPRHHRSVFTLFGNPDALFSAALRLFEVVLESVDLGRHRGEHPRIGSLDVLPFVPLPGARMKEAVELARRTATELAANHGVPVFLYGEAASGRRPLREIRRGGTTGLEQRLRDGEAVPDFGPPRLHPRVGAVAVGARNPLVAYNINLDSADTRIARRIAAAVRETGGGLKGLRALGVEARVGERPVAQVTMNVEHVEETPLAEVFSHVRKEAHLRGIEILGSEIVGLIPQAATSKDMEEDLRLPAPPRTIERALEEHRGSLATP